MKIISLEFEDKATGLKIEEIHFDDLTLLVGASGMGKTKILQILLLLSYIIDKKVGGFGVAWQIKFSLDTDDIYCWEGAFDNLANKNSQITHQDKLPPKFKYEKLFLNNKIIVDRSEKGIIFQGSPTVKLSPSLSVIVLLQEEESIKPIYEAFKNINFHDYSSIHTSGYQTSLTSINEEALQELRQTYNTLNLIRNTNLSITYKLALLFKTDKKAFHKIVQSFMDIFPNVEHIEIGEHIVSQISGEKGAENIRNLWFQIKEKGVRDSFPSPFMSSGMERALIFLSELFLCPDGTVFLIDEFENSLGINCINELVNLMLTNRRPLQFILTSHHPYIIDAIGHKHWKLVTRNGSVIKTHDMEKFNIGKSKHSSFMQLLQLEEYQTGMEQI